MSTAGVKDEPGARDGADGTLAGGGEMGARMRAIDWSRTPLGPVAGWPQALKTSVRIMLTSRQPMFVWWGDALINLYNDAYKAIVGGKHPQALGQPASVVWREIWDQVGPRARSAMRGNEGTYDEALLLIMERNGYPEETYYTFSYSPVPNDAGGTGGILCANTDDTQRIIGERQLTLLRELAAGTAEARTIADACTLSARCLETNPRDVPFALLYRIEPDHQRVVLAGAANVPHGHPIAPETVALDAASPPWPFAAVIRTNAPRLIPDLEASFDALPTGAWDRPSRQAVALPIALAGQTDPAGILIVGLNPYRLFNGNYQRFLGLVSGQIAAAIANARAYEEERRRAEALAEIDRAKTAFFSNVSHEFRTPLTLMLGPLEDALGGDLDAAQREELETVHRNGLRLLRLVNTLLDFSRIEAGRVQASFAPTDLPTLTADLTSTFRAAVERAGLRLVVDTPPLPEGVEVHVDREMWEKVVLNLLSNAFKFTFAGEIAVALHATPDRRAVALTVRDTGTGIAAAELPRLFERFHRVQGAQARTHEGTGIGLALVQELVKLHDGTVAVASEEGRGTTFTVTIPAGNMYLPADRIQTTRPLVSTATGASAFVEEALRWLPSGDEGALEGITSEWSADIGTAGAPDVTPVGGRVLLADDNADMREYVARLLRGRYAVEAVADGKAALAAARERPPDLVLSDVMMPHLDGFGLLEALRADARTAAVPVILLSARAGEEARVEGMQTGANDYLIKPFSARELLARVGAHLELARVRAEVTDRERDARREVEMERERLRALFAQAPAAIAILRGPEHIFTLANAYYRQLVGRDPVGKPTRTAFPGLEGQGFYELLDQVFTSGEPFVGIEMPVPLARRGDGRIEEGYFNFVYQPIKDAGGQVEGIFVHAVDVTDQVRARQQAEAEVVERTRAEALLDGQRIVLELIARGVPLGETLEALARFIEAESNGALCSILLLDRDGLHLRHGAAPSLPNAYNRAIDGIAIGPAVGSCGTAAYRGEPVVVSDIAADPLWADFRELALSHGLRACWSTPIRGADGRMLGTFAVYHREPCSPAPGERALVGTLTYLAGIAIERHHNEEERAGLLDRERAARAEAEAAVRARDEFLSIAAHELRTPVTTIKGTAQLALRAHTRGTLDAARSGKALHTINRMADRFATLTDDLLDVSRIRGGRLALRPERLDLVAFMRGVVERFSEQIEEGHALEADLTGEPVPIEADAGRLEQVFDNLLNNALKYSPGGGTIAVTLAHDAAGVTVAVRDSGIGLPAGAAERIFEPFERAANATAHNLPGMGLGLYVSRQIVELHGGRLWAESPGEGHGATMRVWLPRA